MSNETTTAAKCPFHHTATTGEAATDHDWWPNRLKVELLHQHSAKSDPMGGDFNYAEEFKSLDLAALKKDLAALMTDLQEWWPADFGHYGGLFIRMAAPAPIAPGTGAAAAGRLPFTHPSGTIAASLRISRTSRAVFLSLLLIASGSRVLAFLTQDPIWPKGSSVVMQLGLGPTSLPLQDGFATWNASAADAVAVWNGYLDFITFTSVSAPTVPQASDDGINSVFFSNTIFGDSFDESTIAVTVIESTDDPKVTGETDVIVNNFFRYDSYRGPQQSDASGDIYDLHRVFLHEFGHVLGLDHVTFTPLGQALMEPYISDVDHPAPDDVAGIRFLYGSEISYLPADSLNRVGDAWAFPALKANNSPTSYSVIDLPPGLIMNATTGAISGKVTTAGKYDPVVTAHGPIADAYASFSVSVFGLNEVPGLISIIGGFSANYFVGDPNRPRIYAATDKGIDLINTDKGTVTLVSPGHDLPDMMSISADGSLLFFREQLKTTLHRLDLETLTELPTLTIPSGYSQVVEGQEDRGYTSGPDGVYQIDVTTGAVELTFGPTSNPQIEVTPDRNTLIVTQTEKSISTYDISTATPALIAKHNGSFNGTVPAPDNAHIYCRDSLA